MLTLSSFLQSVSDMPMDVVGEEEVISSHDSQHVMIPLSVQTDSDDNDTDRPTVIDKYDPSLVKVEIDDGDIVKYQMSPVDGGETQSATQALEADMNTIPVDSSEFPPLEQHTVVYQYTDPTVLHGEFE